jgi:WD40 repeat protein
MRHGQGQGLADRLSRAMIWWHPRRWRQRYGEEMLDFLDQHNASARTVLNMAASALTTHLDPAFRTRPRDIRLSPRATTLAVGTATFAVITAIAVVSMVPWPGHEDTWQLSAAGGVNAVAFFPGQRLLVSASGGAGNDSMDAVWDIANPARPVRLSAFQGGQPTALSPDGRLLSTVTYGGQLALWDVADPSRPARIATRQVSDGTRLWGEAFSPDGRTLAAAYGDRVYLWDVASPARPRLLRVLPAPVTPVLQDAFGVIQTAPPGPRDITFSPDGRLLASVTGTSQITVWNVADPARAVRTAVLSGTGDFVQALAFAPRAGLLAGLTYHGTLLVFSLADPARPVRTATAGGLLSRALFPDPPLPPAGPPCKVGCVHVNGPPSYAMAFAADGLTLTVVVDRAETDPSQHNAARDTVFTWTVTSSGALGGLTIAARNVVDNQPTLAPDGQTVADGSPTSAAVYLWKPPSIH